MGKSRATIDRPFGTIRELSPREGDPPRGSVLLLSSESGTAVQRHFSDGSYHTTTGRRFTYAELFTNSDGTSRRVFLLYVPEED